MTTFYSVAYIMASKEGKLGVLLGTHVGDDTPELREYLAEEFEKSPAAETYKLRTVILEKVSDNHLYIFAKEFQAGRWELDVDDDVIEMDTQKVLAS